jgi:hypothetical protein
MKRQGDNAMQQTLSTPRPATRLAPWPWLLLFGRSGILAGCQAFIALGYFLGGSSNAWEASAAWWPFAVTAANLICLGLLVALYRQEGLSYWDLFRVRREQVRGDLLALVAPLVIIGPVAFLPNVLLAGALFGDSLTALNLMLRPLPVWAAYASIVVFPVTQGLVELPIYFAYCMPRLETQGVPRWQAVGLAGLMLGLQHMAVPLLFDARFLTWRGLMFIPFALFTGFILRWRPSLLPYFALVHILMDASFAAMLLSSAY